MLRVLDGYEMTVTAIVGERFLDDIVEGFSVARIFNSTIRAHFLGGSPQVFKPSMPFNTYVSFALAYLSTMDCLIYTALHHSIKPIFRL